MIVIWLTETAPALQVLEDADEVGMGFEADTGESGEGEDADGAPEDSNVDGNVDGAVAAKEEPTGDGDGDAEGGEATQADDDEMDELKTAILMKRAMVMLKEMQRPKTRFGPTDLIKLIMSPTDYIADSSLWIYDALLAPLQDTNVLDAYSIANMTTGGTAYSTYTGATGTVGGATQNTTTQNTTGGGATGGGPGAGASTAAGSRFSRFSRYDGPGSVTGSSAFPGSVMTTGVGSRTKFLRMMVSAKADTTALEAIAHSLSRVTGWRTASSSYVDRLAQLEQELEQSHATKDEAAAAAAEAQETLAAVTIEVEEETVAQVKKLKKKAKDDKEKGKKTPKKGKGAKGKGKKSKHRWEDDVVLPGDMQVRRHRGTPTTWLSRI